MIKAQLPSGATLSFPDNTPDTDIDEAVKKHIRDDKREQRIMDKLDQLQTSIEAVAVEEPEIEEETGPEKEDILAPALNGMIDQLEGIAQILQTKKDRGRGDDHSLIMSVEMLNVSVGALVAEMMSMKEQNETKLEEIAKILRSPRKLIKDANDNPIGSRLEE